MSPLLALTQFFAQRKQQQTLKQLNKQAHLRVLADQLSPHFVFNALNNLRFMLMLDKHKAIKIALDISDIVEDLESVSHENLIDLAAEIALAEKYLRLISIQLGDAFTLKLKLTHRIKLKNSQQVKVLPMMLQLLAENAVKHGLSELNTGSLLIQIKCYRHYLIYRVVNTQVKQSANVLLDVDHKQAQSYAIGINNIRQRLAILYPFQHHFRLKVSNHNSASALLIFPIKMSDK